MRERCMSGSVRGARGNLRPYRDRLAQWSNKQMVYRGAVPTRPRPTCTLGRVGTARMQTDGACVEFTACAPLPTLRRYSARRQRLLRINTDYRVQSANVAFRRVRTLFRARRSVGSHCILGSCNWSKLQRDTKAKIIVVHHLGMSFAECRTQLR